MVANVSFNPNLTTVAQGSFNAASAGLVQGTAYPDPAIRFKLAGGLLATTETLPMWGGVGIFTDVPGVTGGSKKQLGPVVGRATALTNLTAFSVFDQAYGMINTPQSPVPLAGSSMQVMYYRLGSGARIAVACDPALISLVGGLTTAQVSWDYVNQRLVPYAPAYAGAAMTAITYNSTTGVVVLTFASSPGIVVGDDFTVTGIAGITALNGSWTAITGTSGTTVEYNAGAGLIGTVTNPSGSLVGGGGALLVQVLDFSIGDSMTVSYNSTTGFATWNYSGAAAVILI